jgi:hypothetical protein
MDGGQLSTNHCHRFIWEGNGARFGLLPVRKFWAIHSRWRRGEEGAPAPSREITGVSAPGFSFLTFRATKAVCHKIPEAVNPGFGGSSRFFMWRFLVPNPDGLD